MVNASVQVLGILLIIKENVNHVQLLNLDVLTARKTLHINAMNVQVKILLYFMDNVSVTIPIKNQTNKMVIVHYVWFKDVKVVNYLPTQQNVRSV